MAISHAFSNAVANETGTLTIWFGATTATVAATDIVRPQDWNSAHNLIQPIAGNTVGVASVTGTNVVWAGGNNITLSGGQGANQGTITVVGPDLSPYLTTAQPPGAYLTTAALSDHSHGNPTLALTNISGTTASNSAGLTLSLSAGAGGAGDGGVGISAGANSVSAGTVVFSNSNGVSFGLNGSTVTATVATNYQSQGAYLTTAALSNHSHGNPTLALTNLSGTTASNSAGLTLSLSAAAPSAANINVSAGTTSNDVTQIVFSNANGVTFGLDGSTVTASANAGGGAVNTVYFTQLLPAVGYLSISQAGVAHIQNQLAVYPFDVSAALDISAMAIPIHVTNSSTASQSGQVGYTLQMAVYSQGTDTTRIDSMYSTNWTIAASNSSDVSRAISWANGIVNETSYNAGTSSSAGLNLSSLFHGSREAQIAYKTMLDPGRYWIACAVSTSVAGTSQGVLSINWQAWRLGLSQDMLRLNTVANNATVDGGLQMAGLGIYSVTTAAIPASIGFSELNRENQQIYPVVQFRKSIY